MGWRVGEESHPLGLTGLVAELTVIIQLIIDARRREFSHWEEEAKHAVATLLGGGRYPLGKARRDKRASS